MIDISVKDLVKSFEIGNHLLDGLSFDINEGERVGIMGRNGCGKTTLFRILTGEISPDEGTVMIAPGKKRGLISQIPHYPAGYTVEDVLRTAFAPLLAMREKMTKLEHAMGTDASKQTLAEYDRLSAAFASGGGYEMDVQTDKVCGGLGIPAEQRAQEFDRLSGGEKTRVNLARLLLEKTDILLLDEPTEFYSGNYSFYLEEKQNRFNLQLKQYEQEQAKLRQLGYTLERMKGWGINNRTLYRRAMSIQHRMERIAKTERPRTEKTLRARFDARDFFGDEMFTVKRLSKSFGGRTLFSDVNLEVKGGERIALLGDNGTGKSTFLRILLGEEPCDAGTVRFGPTVRYGYLPQIIRFEHPERSLYDTMLYEKNYTPQAARDRLGAFAFSGEDVFKSVSTLSGGEQSRLRLCMLMDDKINLLVLDEPTNHLDIASREWIECAIDEYEGTLLFVSHDRYFVDKFATRVWELENGVIRDFKCGYAKYRSIKAHEQMNLQQAPAPRPEKKEKPRNPDKQNERKLRALEREIEAMEQRLADFDTQISQTGADYQTLSQLMEERQALESELDEKMAQWAELSPD